MEIEIKQHGITYITEEESSPKCPECERQCANFEISHCATPDGNYLVADLECRHCQCQWRISRRQRAPKPWPTPNVPPDDDWGADDIQGTHLTEGLDEGPPTMMSGRDHINEQGEFQSDKYAWCKPGFVPLKITDHMAHQVLWDYAAKRQFLDQEFSEDLRTCLLYAGFEPAVNPEREQP